MWVVSKFDSRTQPVRLQAEHNDTNRDDAGVVHILRIPLQGKLRSTFSSETHLWRDRFDVREAEDHADEHDPSTGSKVSNERA